MIAIISVAMMVRSVRDKPQQKDMPTAAAAPTTQPSIANPRADRMPAPVVSDTGQPTPSGTSPSAAPTTQPSVAAPRPDRKPAALVGDTGQMTRSGTSTRAAPATQPSIATARTDRKPAAVVGDTGQGTSSGTSPETPLKAGAAEIAVVNLAITPWGEVYVDGKKQGVSPPLQALEIALGEHTIEVRNPGFPSHFETVNANAGAQLRIKHKFQ